ncbi:endocuticle structural glycoprotein ABD-5-like isoform X3 [Colias croceus]|uniref:endocuticle structural glycoprotein ABD-5-like isoform X2 n=1 Tax=Colias crocea TaxID=72248 RepID=UPI001E27D431|nr:endocuticle structural glycoprotein ABD-5-like isoform X2 [Colias croceus]XP_045493000.1 endocuticle structural glycoprotein ABD-5-like isoform X3 [Colias croceus]CAG4937512.1 unnamed protein product [Colias eurytheme]
MKLLIVLCIAVAAVSGAVLPSDNVQILRYDNDNIGLGNYRYAYEQNDGTKQEQQGEIINEGREDESLVVRGSFSWVGPDGVTYKVTYVADSNGYQPEIEEGPGGAVPPGVVASLLG